MKTKYSFILGKRIRCDWVIIKILNNNVALMPNASASAECSDISDDVFIFGHNYYSDLKVNFCPPIDASYMRPPLLWTNIAIPLT